LYFQPGADHPAQPVHNGRIREEVAVKAAATGQVTPAVFVAMSPCRVINTRDAVGPYGGPAFAAGETRTYTIPSGPCTGLPASAVAYSVNITVVPLGTQMKWLTAWDTGSTQPLAATLVDYTGLILSNAAVVPAGSGGAISIYVTDPTQVVVDINGYYAPPGTLPLTGTAAAPALTFGDTTTGLYSDAAGTVSIGTEGTSRLTVRADGDLELPGSIRKDGQLFLHTLPASTELNTALGLGALQNIGVTLGGNTAVGAGALQSMVNGSGNTAVGTSALINGGGNFNTAVGNSALASAGGCCNTAVGQGALEASLGALGNTGVGQGALGSLTVGGDNVALGSMAGSSTLTGSNNVYIANQGMAGSESSTIRIGDSHQSRTFITAIRGVTTGNPDAVPVLIDSAGQLGTASSSRRVKRDIEDMGDTSEAILRLRPVRFRYQVYGADSPVQYGLIAEEVAEVAPELVARDKDGRVETVYYDKVNAMLLNEVQKLHRENRALESRLEELEGLVRGSGQH
jgi:hypothetical protein